jgi:formate dehydrogenase major subunit
MAHVIVEEGLADEQFIANRVSDWPQFQQFLERCTPESAAGICGVSADLIREAARLYATRKPAMCIHGLGITEHLQGTESVMCLANLAMVTGNIGRPGAGVNPLRGQNNVQGSAHMGCEPDHLTGYASLESASDQFAKAWKAALPQRKGLNLMRMIDAAAADQVKAIWAIGYDVSLTNPGATATRAALARLDLLIVQDLFLNRTAELAHVFLPAASPFEKDGTFMNAERRVQRIRAAAPPRGNARPDWQIICEVARAMGHGGQFAFESAEQVWNEIRSVWPAGAGISYRRLENGGLQWPCPNEDHPGTAVLHKETFPGGRRAPLQCVPYIATPEQASEQHPFILTTGRALYQFNAGTMTMRTRNAELHPIDYLDISPADALRLAVRNGDQLRIRSQYGSTVLPARINPAIKPGELFTTFHTTEANVNAVTSGHRDRRVDTPEYKVTAVSLERLCDDAALSTSPTWSNP